MPNHSRVQLRAADRFCWVVLSRVWSRWWDALFVVKPETVIAWHRRGFRWYWRCKSRARPVGRPRIPRELIDLIRSMQRANPAWGAPRIHGGHMVLSPNWHANTTRCASTIRQGSASFAAIVRFTELARGGGSQPWNAPVFWRSRCPPSGRRV